MEATGVYHESIRHDERVKAIFVRLVGKHGIKMKAVVAVQRKLLEMMYTLYLVPELFLFIDIYNFF